MTRYITRWTALLAWAALMAIVWVLFVPRGLSIGSFTLLSLTGPFLLIVASMVWSNQRPTPSLRQTRVELEATEAATRARR